MRIRTANRWMAAALAMALANGLTGWPACPARAGDDKGPTQTEKDLPPLSPPPLSPPPTTPPTSTAPLTETVVIRLKHTDASQTANVLQKIFEERWTGSHPVKFAADPQANALLIRGTESQLREVVALLGRLDAAQQSETPPSKITLLPLGQVEPSAALEKTLRLAFADARSGNFAIDPGRKIVVLAADRLTTERVADLLARLAAAEENRSEDLQVRVVWLVSDPALKNVRELPDDLKAMMPGLAKLGLAQAQMAAQFVVNTQPNSQFQAKGTAKLGTKLGETPCHLSVSGRLNNTKGPARLEIRIQATRGTSTAKEEICDLQTEINAPPGHLVALGVTPSDNLSSAFVVQILGNGAGMAAPKR